MTSSQDQKNADTGPVVLSIDAMGGDRGPAAVVAGISRSVKNNPDLGFLIHGPADTLTPLLSKKISALFILSPMAVKAKSV